MKYLNNPPHLKRVATLPCEIVMFKNLNDPELCEENCHARLSHSKHLLNKCSPSDVGIISVHWRKDIYGGRIKKPTEWLTECICSDQEERRRDRTPAHD